jgi:hypothetical protein
MSERYTVPVRFKSLEDSEEHGHDATVALAAELDGATVTEPDDDGIFQVELESDSRDEAVDRVWEIAVTARVADYIEQVG